MHTRTKTRYLMVASRTSAEAAKGERVSLCTPLKASKVPSVGGGTGPREAMVGVPAVMPRK